MTSKRIKRIRYKDLDKFVARFALEKGYRLETARKKLLWMYMGNNRILIELLKTVREGVKTIDVLGDTIDKEQLRTLNRVIKQAEEDSWLDHEEGNIEGYEEGVNDFGESERRKDILKKKGFLVVGDRPKKGPKVRT
jgi:hypothetical protein